MAEKTKSKNIPQEVQLNSISKLLTTLAAGFIVIVGIQYIAQDILAPILMAVFLAILLVPLFKIFRKKGYSTGKSVFLMIVTLILVGGGLVLFLTWSFGLLRDSLSVYLADISTSIDQVATSLGINTGEVENLTQRITPEALLNIFTSILSGLGGILTYLVFVPILAILMLIQMDSLPSNIVKDLSSGNSGFDKLKKFSDSIIIYVTGRLKVNIVTGTLFAIALILIGIDFPFVWGFLTIILSFIPYIGIIIAGTPPTLIAFANYGLTGALLVIGSIAIINIFAENVLDPYIQGKGNKISTAAIVVALIFWTWLLGPIGAILSSPLTVLLKIIFADYKETAWIASIMEGNYSEAKPTKTINIKGFQNSIKSFITTNK